MPRIDLLFDPFVTDACIKQWNTLIFIPNKKLVCYFLNQWKMLTKIKATTFNSFFYYIDGQVPVISYTVETPSLTGSTRLWDYVTVTGTLGYINISASFIEISTIA
jgi:hypothetical protein